MKSDALSERRAAKVAYANGTLALEGLKVTEAARLDQERYIRGEINTDQLLANALKRHKK